MSVSQESDKASGCFNPDLPSGNEYPEDGWLRGYFLRTRSDEAKNNRVVKGIWKNVDFLRLRDVALHLLDSGPGKTILDVGCADGATMVYCGLQGATVYGQDLNPTYVEKANRALKRYGIKGRAQCGDAVQLGFPEKHFDAAISSDFFEHISDGQKSLVLKEILRVLKPGAALIIKTPNLNYLKLALFYKRLCAIARFRNPYHIVIPHTPGTEDPQHIGLITRWHLSRLLTQSGFLSWQFFYAPLRRFGTSHAVEILSTEFPVVRDFLCEDIFVKAFKPIALSHFPD